MNKALYFLIDMAKDLTEEDFVRVTSVINELKGVGLDIPENEKNVAYLFYESAPFRAKITLVDTPTDFQSWGKNLRSKRLEVEAEVTDSITPNLLRDILLKQGIRVFFTNINCWLPRRMDIEDCFSITNENHEKAKKILEKNNLRPVFLLHHTYIYYALSTQDNSVHIVNDNLLYYLIHLENPEIKIDELSYKVADNLEEFVRKFDAEIIPTLFYDYYNKSFKIMNYSGFDIENPGRKVFVKPYIMQYDNESIDFFKIAWDQSALLFMDKIRPGENLDRAIIRILKDELKIATDYIGATVARIVEYDLDKENKVTPRLIVRIFIKEAQMTPEQLAQKERTWISFNQVKK